MVEDDGALREGLCELLAREGYRTKSAATAREADALIQAGSFDLCLMDVGLPDGDGVSLCCRWRAEGRNFPIIFLTALDEEIHVVRALDAGADLSKVTGLKVRERIGRAKYIPEEELKQFDAIEAELNAQIGALAEEE